MKTLNKVSLYIGTALACFLGQSCSMEEPFGAGGEGTLTLNTEIRGNVVRTRAIAADELTALRNRCVVYIENEKGLIRKYKGLDNIPAEGIKLRTGSYVAEAWSGDSVSASFSSKFYRGWQSFEMQEGANSLTLRCNIANVIVSVDPASLGVNLTDLKVTYWHSRGELVFDQNNIADAKGYFMMPNADKDLNYKIEGKKSSGEAYEKTGVIENVQRAHEYILTLSEEEAPITEGGALIRITIADIPVIEEEVEIFTAPAIQGVGYDIEGQVVSKDRDFKDTQVYIRGYFGLGSVLMNVSDNFTDLTSGLNLIEGSTQTELAAKGIKVERRQSTDAASSLESGEVPVDELYVTFTKTFLDALAASDTEYKITFEATDGRHNVSTGSLRIANSEAAEEHLAPVGISEAELSPLAIRAKRATLDANIYDAAAAVNYGIKYREQGSSEWQAAYPASGARAKATRAAVIPYQVTLTGLTPGTTYEYIAFCDGFDGADVRTFKTESEFTIPGNSFEEWSTYSASTLLGTKNVTLPWSVGDKEASFWGSGNEGAATANMTLTNKSTDMIVSGTYSARLESKSALGMLAAGNLFIGTYVKTDGTDGVLSLGREYNGSHPDKLVIWANYRSGSGVKVKDGNESFVPDGFAGGNDHGQVYVALTDEPIEIRTKASQRKVFDTEDEHVLAYGQVTWTENFGADGQLERLEIPFVYNDRAKTKKPVYLIMVASASKYGDYFSGAAGSVMYLDDVELIYE